MQKKKRPESGSASNQRKRGEMNPAGMIGVQNPAGIKSRIQAVKKEMITVQKENLSPVNPAENHTPEKPKSLIHLHKRQTGLIKNLI
jgi:hypothetical protein